MTEQQAIGLTTCHSITNKSIHGGRLLSNKYVVALIGIIIGVVIGFIIGFIAIAQGKAEEIRALTINTDTLRQSNLDLFDQVRELGSLHEDSQLLEAELSRVLLSAASGGGLNMKMMPHPETGEATVPLPEVFSFDSNHAFCRVDTNREAFIMPTYAMGDLLIEKNQFFMSMSTTSIDDFSVSKNSDGLNTVTITGGLDCLTEVAKANMTLGSREVAEYAEYKIQAIDGGLGGGAAGDYFKFTVYFDSETAPVNYQIFGPEFTFTGDMIEGEITIPTPR